MNGDMRAAAQEHFWWTLRCWAIARKQILWSKWRPRSVVLGCVCGWRSIENQIWASQRPPGEPGWWCIRALSFCEMAEQQSPRQQKDPRARKHSFFLPLSCTANRRQSEKAKRDTEGELWGKMSARSHPFTIVPKYRAITAVCQVFCLDPSLQLGFPKALKLFESKKTWFKLF